MTAIIERQRSFSKIDPRREVGLPNLLAVQLQSYEKFLQKDTPPEKRKNMGLQEVFNTIFPIEDSRGIFSLEFVSYSVGEPKYTVEECQERDLTYSVPLKVKLRLRVRREENGRKVDQEIIEPPEIYLGELPLITEKGTFVVNGAERVIVSQLHRSPGAFFDQEVHPNGKRLYSARVIPYRGSWVEFSLDVKDLLFVHIDRRRKLHATTLLRALGISTDKDILDLFYEVEELEIGSPRTKKMRSLIQRVAAEDIVDPETGEILLEVNHPIPDEETLKRIYKALGPSAKIKVYKLPEEEETDVIRRTLEKDPAKTEEEALARIYNLIRPGETARIEAAREILNRLFFSPKRYDLGKVGRYKLNRKLRHEILLGPPERMKRFGLTVPSDDVTTLTKEDFIAIMKYLLLLRMGDETYDFIETDDIDHLGNRRVRSVGELLAKEFNTGLARMARIIRERMSLQDPEDINPTDFVNARTVSAAIQSFFGSSQLSQFMDQTNPLAELTHKRRLSALGPGGLTRERAGFEVRDVHYTHYGRMCPIETPEGPNIGLISSLATYARVNELGFLETPYRVVKNGVVTDEIVYVAADAEDNYVIAQANEPLDEKGRFKNPLVSCRHRGEFPMMRPEEVDLMDVSPMQTVSPAAALIPFLEHDDANRALMGSNMQRQAVPLLRTEPPLVATGLEARVAHDSGAVVLAKRGGVVEWVSSDSIAIRYNPSEPGPLSEFTDHPGLDIYHLVKFKRSNQDTCINQRPIVKKGQRVKAGDVIADGPATCNGQLALGANVLVAFMPWGGYNFEDAILVSEGLVKRDVFTSIHIEEFELQVRETKRGMEEITREIPNVGEDALRHLDEDGIVTVGSWVKAGDILVGKVTPKGESDLTPEERLLRAIFGEKAGDVRDASLKAPPGMEGVVIDIKVFSRKEKDETARKQERKKIERLKRLARKEKQQIRESRDEELVKLLTGQILERWENKDGEMIFRAGRKGTPALFEEVDFDDLPYRAPVAKDPKVNSRFWQIMDAATSAMEKVDLNLEKEIEKISRGDELPSGVAKLVKVFVAKKRKLSVGDKMAGRHGNKGVVAKILPEEDMPFLPDGTPVDIVLNPLGVPSRMNIGQILETHLGWAAHKMRYQAITPVFAGATVEEIKEALREAGLPEDGKMELYDGRTGEKFDERVTVGYIYMMKLSHLVDDKIHARSIGPYSLVTQQPLGGKAQFGGQRFGEMEVWALEAYGAAYTLQELLTVKSDDVEGRSRMYEAIVKGDNPPEPGVPESFNVLVRELRSLCLDIQFE
jgi:DNA-directed RNA polymerase subunit beta